MELSSDQFSVSLELQLSSAFFSYFLISIAVSSRKIGQSDSITSSADLLFSSVDPFLLRQKTITAKSSKISIVEKSPNKISNNPPWIKKSLPPRKPKKRDKPPSRRQLRHWTLQPPNLAHDLSPKSTNQKHSTKVPMHSGNSSNGLFSEACLSKSWNLRTVATGLDSTTCCQRTSLKLMPTPTNTTTKPSISILCSKSLLPPPPLSLTVPTMCPMLWVL